MDGMRDRLKAELKARGKSQADAARDAGLPDSQGLRDVLAGRKRLSAELLAALALAGIDVLYVLIGRRSVAPIGMAESEIETFNQILDIFWSASDETRDTVLETLKALHLRDVHAGTARGVRKRVVADAEGGARAPAGRVVTKVTAKGKGTIAIGSIHGGTQTIKPSKA